MITGTFYQDIATNFVGALTNRTHVAAWLQFDVVAPNGGGVKQFEREIVDRIGAAARLNGGAVSYSAGSGSQTLFNPLDTLSTQFLANRVPEQVFRRNIAKMMSSSQLAVTASQTFQTLAGLTARTSEQEKTLGHIAEYDEQFSCWHVVRSYHKLLQQSGEEYKLLGNSLHVKAYAVEPNIVTFAARHEISTSDAKQTVTADSQNTATLDWLSRSSQ